MKKLLFVFSIILMCIGLNAQMEGSLIDTVTVSGTTNTTNLYTNETSTFAQVPPQYQNMGLFTTIEVGNISGTSASVIYIDACSDSSCDTTFPVDTITVTAAGKFMSYISYNGTKHKYRIETASSTQSTWYKIGFILKRLL